MRYCLDGLTCSSEQIGEVIVGTSIIRLDLQHRAILKAIASGDAELAGRAMYDHVIESRERALRAADLPQPARARAGRKA